jgi:Asp-tRNA(Asn)/Glu-tRNA(Gln) amidotransferase B subunit
MSYCTNSEISTSKISLDRFTAFVQDVIKYSLKDTNAKIALETMVEENTDSQSAISKHGFDKTEEIDYISLSHQAMDANPAIVEQYRSGKTPVIMFLV